MSDKTNKQPQDELVEVLTSVMQKFAPGGAMGPIEDRNEWDKMVASQPPGEREIVAELTNFFDMCKYLEQCGRRPGEAIVTAFEVAAKLPTRQRLAKLKEVNQQLMQQVADAGASAEFRN